MIFYKNNEDGRPAENPVGRFAPSPTGRMHLGNIFAALMSWLSVKSRGGKWILRIEDLDPQRSRPEYARQIEDDLLWLGLVPDEGGVDKPEYVQSARHEIYEEYLRRLSDAGYTYPCTCTRADIRASSAPHPGDGRIIYSGRCRPADAPPFGDGIVPGKAVRLYVPDTEIVFTDGNYGLQKQNPAKESGDIVLRRADGAWAYQLAVTVDDALMGVTDVVRGADLLPSVGVQSVIRNILGFPHPEYTHIPLLTNSDGVRLSKRDASVAMDALRKKHTPESIIGFLAWKGGLIPESAPCTAESLIPLYHR